MCCNTYVLYATTRYNATSQKARKVYKINLIRNGVGERPYLLKEKWKSLIKQQK